MTNRLTTLAADLRDERHLPGGKFDLAAADLLDQVAPLDDLDMPCETCDGMKMVACPGPNDGCYGMHMGHPCPVCDDGQASPAVKLRKLIAVYDAVQQFNPHKFATRNDGANHLRQVGRDA